MPNRALPGPWGLPRPIFADVQAKIVDVQAKIVDVETGSAVLS